MDYRKFGGYPLAKALAVGCAKAADGFPRYEQLALALQLRRAAYSAVLNIPEGFNRRGTPSLRHYMQIAYTSINEVGLILELSLDLGYINEAVYRELKDLQEEAARLMFGFLRSLAPRKSDRRRSPARPDALNAETPRRLDA